MDYDKKLGIEEFEKALSELKINLSDYQIEQFIKYYELLIHWNKLMNLTSITDFMEVINKHFVDSLSMVKVYRPSNEKILDLGTGAGFPGVPLKIAFPNTKVVLMDSLNKRVRFLNEVIKELDLDNIIAIHGRAEDYGREKDYRESFDISTSRAVAKLSTLSEYCLPFVKKEGLFIAYKSGNISEELEEASKAIKVLGGKVMETKEFTLPFTDINRSFIIIKKNNITPNKYPRTAGKPSKEPL
ncbi:16S rRNA (guanine(527)-N(7))-methyltransferase RsmG [Herbinix luporum]|uniref:Ribosomal RNA small subunit methyltransferase G n=1 Tax=Herbinix luporum TaxID=1679721 RepID=A0A0K8J8J0_9FIRM|nr:16S rRNA (guanine(527)-N(7))-methyltransferase RsmG [Herbinix luporum]CUH93931.1 Ribosomal RNA small subunit methyltransferase G [Herbinix luporum]